MTLGIKTVQWGEAESDCGTANMVWDCRHVAAYSKHHKMQLILRTDVLLSVWFFLSEQWKLWLILEVTDRWWILYSIAGSNSNIKAMMVGHILLQLGSSPERKVIFTATAGPYLRWVMTVWIRFSHACPCSLGFVSVARLELLTAISSCPSVVSFFKLMQFRSGSSRPGRVAVAEAAPR